MHFACLQWGQRSGRDHYNAHSPLAAGNDIEGWYHDPTLQCPLAACHLVNMSADVLFMFLRRRPPLSFLLPPRRNVNCLSLTPLPDNVYHVSPDFDGATSPESSSESWLILTNLSPPSRHLWSAAFSAHGVVIKYSTHAKLRRYLKIFAMTAAIIKLQPTKTSVLIRIAQKQYTCVYKIFR